jgi:ATPase family associated with various cellular activities (AAA)
MADEFLTQELPAIRRAQERSLVALESMIRLVEWGLWKKWRGKDDFPAIIPLRGEISELVKPEITLRRRPAGLQPTELSLATFAVCLDAIDSIAEARGILSLPGAEGVRQKAVRLRQHMIDNLEQVSSGLKKTQSRAFGTNDPVTASWLLPILPVTAARSAKGPKRFERKLGDVKLFENVRKGIERLLVPEHYMIVGGSGSRRNTAEEHAWPVSLAVRALNLVTKGDPKQALEPITKRTRKSSKQDQASMYETLRVWSEQQVRQQLARSVTAEAGQDAAHLAAALAVAMWLEELPLPLLEAAAAQLCAMQRPDGSLALTRPYLADTEGSVITPLAADATLQMIAVADQLDVRYRDHPTALRIERQLLEAVQQQREAYFRSSMRKSGTGPNGEGAMVWSSDRARPTPDTCDTWATARTVTALVMILNLESRLITRRLLEESRFSYRSGDQIDKGFDKLTDPEQVTTPGSGQSGGRASRAGPRITLAADTKSPLRIEIRGTGFAPNEKGTIRYEEASCKFQANGSGRFRVALDVPPTTRAGIKSVRAKGNTSRAEEDFRRTVVSALRDGLTAPDPEPKRRPTRSARGSKPKSATPTRAVLLCGPPGTSKTSLIEAVAKQLADDLVDKQPGRYLVYLVQLSPADFLLDGPDKVEHRAKRIFDYLTQMENVVVLFDEIDRLILDRGSPEYDAQEDVFQFMTPSMLPKLTALRKRGSVVRFAIATNYSERIDPAIARRGRIDESFVIAPPNLDARTTILEKEGLPRPVAQRLAAVTPLWVYGDLATLSAKDKPADIMLQSPSGSLASYKSRRFTPRKEILADEILQQAELYLEDHAPEVLKRRPPDETRAIGWAAERASRDRQKEAKVMIELLKEEGVVGPFEPWDEEEEEEKKKKHPPPGPVETAALG